MSKMAYKLISGVLAGTMILMTSAAAFAESSPTSAIPVGTVSETVQTEAAAQTDATAESEATVQTEAQVEAQTTAQEDGSIAVSEPLVDLNGDGTVEIPPEATKIQAGAFSTLSKGTTVVATTNNTVASVAALQEAKENGIILVFNGKLSSKNFEIMVKRLKKAGYSEKEIKAALGGRYSLKKIKSTLAKKTNKKTKKTSKK